MRRRQRRIGERRRAGRVRPEATTCRYGRPSTTTGTPVTVDTSQGTSTLRGTSKTPLPGQTYAGGTDAFVQKLDGSLARIVDEPVRHRRQRQRHSRRGGWRGERLPRGHHDRRVPGVHHRILRERRLRAGLRRRAGPSGGRRSSEPSSPRSRSPLRWTGRGTCTSADTRRADFPGFENAGGAALGPVSEWNDAFLRKYGADGTELWTQQFGHERHDEILGVAVDGSGSVYVSGYTDASFEGYSNPGGRDAFIRKYDPDGNVVWTRQFGSGSAAGGQPNDKALDIALDASGNIYVSGSTTGVFEGENSGGGNDGFVAQDGRERRARVDSTVRGRGRRHGRRHCRRRRRHGLRRGQHRVVHSGARAAPELRTASRRVFDSNGGDRWTKTVGTRRVDGAHDIAQGSGACTSIGGTEGEIGPGGAGKGDAIDSDVFVLRLSR